MMIPLLSTLPVTLSLLLISSLFSSVIAQCPFYSAYASEYHGPYTEARWNLSYMRPIPPCRTFISHEVEDTIERLKGVIVDPDLFRVFENSWPSTLDTTVAWRGFANRSAPEKWRLEEMTAKLKIAGGNDAKSGKKGKERDYFEKEDEDEEEELAFVVTGDITAMWLRDSANQLQAYTSLLKHNSSFDSLASIFRGAINLQARYILSNPFCNAFQAPTESGLIRKSSANSDQIRPSYDYMEVFSCQWELDSVASFLDLSASYYKATGDWKFFTKHHNKWSKAVRKLLDTAESMRMDSYDADGFWQHTPYTYCAPYGGTPINECNGSPHRGNIGLVRSFHRPSDDACTYQYLIPSNMMFSATLNSSSAIMDHVETFSGAEKGHGNLTTWMKRMSSEIREGIETYGVIRDLRHGKIYAFEVDGYGGANIMDDANIPSLLSAPFLNYVAKDDKIYTNTRRKMLSRDNPYYAWGPLISGIGSPHTKPGKVWPMASIMAILTSDDDVEIVRNLRWLVQSTNGFGVMHESQDAHRKNTWSRQWFSWANGMFGQAILDLEVRKPHILKMGFQ